MVRLQCDQILQSRKLRKTEGVADICAKMFGCNFGSFVLVTEIILNHCNDFPKKSMTSKSLFSNN
jgi:hypothetical protein